MTHRTDLPDDPVYAFCPAYEPAEQPQQIRIVFRDLPGYVPTALVALNPRRRRTTLRQTQPPPRPRPNGMDGARRAVHVRGHGRELDALIFRPERSSEIRANAGAKRPMKPFSIERRWMAPAVLIATAVAFHGPASAETWRGLTVAPEHRCAPYDRRDYPYSQSVEARIVAAMGGRVYGPYTGRAFADRRRTDIEHIVAVSEAHDSGLCAASAATRRRFASDLLNLTPGCSEGEPLRQVGQVRQGRRRMATAPKPLLVREPRRRGAPQVPPHHRSPRGRSPRTDPLGLHVHGDGVLRRRRRAGVRRPIRYGKRYALRRHRARPLGRQRQRTHLLPRGAPARHRAGAARSSRLPVHARRRRRRDRVRIGAGPPRLPIVSPVADTEGRSAFDA